MANILCFLFNASKTMPRQRENKIYILSSFTSHNNGQCDKTDLFKAEIITVPCNTPLLRNKINISPMIVYNKK